MSTNLNGYWSDGTPILDEIETDEDVIEDLLVTVSELSYELRQADKYNRL